jgi:hypothetical protein
MNTSDVSERPSRRRVLAGLGAVALAGCGSRNGDSTPDEPTFDRLDATSVHVDDGVDLSVPEAVSTVDARTNAAVLVLPGDAAVDTEQVADWLADEKILALSGPDAQPTWVEWAESDAVDEHFDTSGVSEAEPAPQLVVAAAAGLSLPTFRTTWGEEPADREVWAALDGALVDVRERRRAE